MRALRAAAAQRSAVHRQVGWPLDRCTGARIRIGAVWKAHPQFTAQQIIHRLGPGPFLTVPGVQKILRECWGARGRPTRNARLTSRRRYNTARTGP